MPRKMTESERADFLRGVNVGVLSVGRPERGPLTVPVWFEYRDGRVFFTSGATSRKTALLRQAGRASLCVHNNSLPYWYVTVEGPVQLTQRGAADLESIAVRYLGSPEAARDYANGVTWDGVLARLSPEQWLTVVYP
jgi:uncharacterized protein